MASHLNYFERLVNMHPNHRKDAMMNLFLESRGWDSESVDYEKGIVRYNFPIDYDKLVIMTYDYHKEFKDEVSSEKEKLKSFLEKSVLDIFLTGNKPNSFLEIQMRFLSELSEKARKIYFDYPFVEKSINDVIVYFSSKYEIKIPPSKKPQRISPITKISYFDVKSDVKNSIFKKLYIIAVDMELIDDEEVSLETFMKVMTQDCSNSEIAVRFRCQNYLIVCFIDSIQSLYYNFTYSRIEKSKCFINKGGKLLNATDLSRAKSRQVGKATRESEKLKEEIEVLIRKLNIKL